MVAKTRPAGSGDFWKFFNFKRISDITKIHRDKIYNNFKGTYDSMSDEDMSKISKALMPNVIALFKYLGYDVKFNRIKE